MIKSISFDEGEILRDINLLYLNSRGVQLDPTYSAGNIYKNNKFPEPIIRMDLNPQSPGVEKFDVRDLPFQDGQIRSILFDPPFVDGNTKGTLTGRTQVRFGGAYSVNELWTLYNDSLVELYRVLRKGGILIFKCQDIVSGRMNYFSHSYILNAANKAGFYAKDLFILLAEKRMSSSNWDKQFHARKFHCYYWVFSKQKMKAVNHFLNL